MIRTTLLVCLCFVVHVVVCAGNSVEPAGAVVGEVPQLVAA